MCYVVRMKPWVFPHIFIKNLNSKQRHALLHLIRFRATIHWSLLVVKRKRVRKGLRIESFVSLDTIEAGEVE